MTTRIKAGIIYLNNSNYYYFKNNVYYYKAKLGTALGVLSTEDYYPTIFSFFRSNVASDSYVNEAQEITYLFVDFEDKLDIKDLVSVDVEYYKLQYDYIRYCPFITETDGFFNIENIKNNYFSDIYSGLYESKEFGNLENGISLNGNSTSLVSYNKDVSIFNNDGTNVTKNLNYDELQEVEGGVITLTIFGVTLVGAKAIAAIAGGVTAVGGAAGLGFYLGYK